MIDVDDQPFDGGAVGFAGRFVVCAGVVVIRGCSDGAGTGLDPQFRSRMIQMITTGEVDISDGSLVLPVKTDTGDPASRLRASAM